MKLKHSLFTIALVLFINSLVLADTGSHLRSKVQIRGLDKLRALNVISVAQSSAIPGQRLEQIEPIILNTDVTGVGRIQIELTEQWIKDWPAFFTAADGSVHQDDSKVLLLRGTYTLLSQQEDQSKTKTFPIAVTVIEGEKGPKLTAYFLATRRIREDLYSYSINLDLNQEADDLWAVVHHVPRSVYANYRCGVEASPAQVIHQASVLPITAAASGNRTVQLATEADFEYFSLHGANTNSIIAGIVNAGQTIYDSTFDVDFSITAQNSQTSASQPYTSTDSDTLLDQFRDYTNTNKHLGWADLFHLFTGKDVDGTTIGKAYLGVMCKSLLSRFGFTQQFAQATDHFTFAHEVAHNFNASHDDSSPNIMNTMADPNGTSFSSQTVTEVENYLSSNWRCLGVTAEPVQQIVMTGAKDPQDPSKTRFDLSLTSDQGWGTFGIVDFLGRASSNLPFQVLVDDLDLTSVSSGYFTVTGTGEFKASIVGTNLETDIITVKADGTVVNPAPTPTITPGPTATATPNPNMTLTGKFLKPRRNKFICKVRVDGNNSVGETVALDKARSKNGAFTEVKIKTSTKKGLAKFPTRRIKRKTFLRCRVGATVSRAKKFRGIRRS